MPIGLSDKYVYTPLDVSRREIRVLRLLPPKGNPSSKIECVFENMSLNDNINFNSLSYTWGDEPGDSAIDNSPKLLAIVVEGKSIPVTPNLFGALLHFCEEAEHNQQPDDICSRRPPHHYDTRLWIDALSIDQNNVQERNEQVYAFSSDFLHQARHH